ncbi:transferrin-binding protein-like solute binding protein [Actinobacillus equuli]|uniref:transferrin-binding protein-like solute binding protein n=1 Tax=Actinobacillus equuli TaxID=718 RepID=UPI002442C24B|nr:transferrin-binding protein-like solute binding protein [Actinobacillus equuli]WGE78947.1 transferrin-binding protein-like solute binding protein [Actinobacillus equuli subsp. equuli]
MNVVTKLTATLAASLILTACSGGSSGSATKPNNQKAKTDIPAPKVEQSKEAASQADNLKVEQPKEVVPQVDNSKVEQPKEAASQADNSKVEQPKEVVPQVDNSKVEQPKEVVPQVDNSKVEQPKEAIPQADNSKVEQPKEAVPQADNSKVEQPKEAVPQVDNSKVEQPKEAIPQADNSKVEQPKEVVPQVDHSNMEQPKEVAPKVNTSNLEEPNKNKSNVEILKELGIRDTSGLVSNADVVLNLEIDDKDQIKIILDKNEINRNSLKVTNTIPIQEIKTLKDSSGKLLGYYGYMQLSQAKQDERYSMDSVHLASHYLLAMNEEEKVRPTKSIEYRGNMLYGYINGDSRKLVADVQAKYDDLNKKLSMEIFGNGEDYWKLGTIGRNKLASNKVNGVSVAADGSIANANLYSKTNDPLKLTPDANFSGGLFGKNGEVLAGKAESIKGEWQGVIGATATEEKK